MQIPTALAVAAALIVACAGCTAPAPGRAGSDESAGGSRLAPSFAPARPSQHPAARRSATASHEARPRPHPARTGSPSPRAAHSSGPAPFSAAVAGRPSAKAEARTASVRDPSGDVRGGLGTPPSYVDLTGASLVLTPSGYRLTVTAAGDFPQRQGNDGRTTNVAGFFDVDGDGTVDYEVWASLADTGWGTSYRAPDGASFGAGSGVTARPDGRALVLSFPRDHVPGDGFRWAVGAEWGSYEQVGSGSTASDHAPDAGSTRFPG